MQFDYISLPCGSTKLWQGKYIYIEHGLGAMKYYTYKYSFFHNALNLLKNRRRQSVIPVCICSCVI